MKLDATYPIITVMTIYSRFDSLDIISNIAYITYTHKYTIAKQCCLACSQECIYTKDGTPSVKHKSATSFNTQSQTALFLSLYHSTFTYIGTDSLSILAVTKHPSIKATYTSNF